MSDNERYQLVTGEESKKGGLVWNTYLQPDRVGQAGRAHSSTW